MALVSEDVLLNYSIIIIITTTTTSSSSSSSNINKYDIVHYL